MQCRNSTTEDDTSGAFRVALEKDDADGPCTKAPHAYDLCQLSLGDMICIEQKVYQMEQ